MADLLWSGAGLSGHYKSSTICPPTSVYSLPLRLVDKVGGWDAGEDAIGEDLHMYIKCFFALQGNLSTRTVLSAASQSNVHSSGKGHPRIVLQSQRALPTSIATHVGCARQRICG